MWFLSLLIMLAVLTLALNLVFDDYLRSFRNSLLIVVIWFSLLGVANDYRLINKFKYENTLPSTEQFQPVYETKHYCYLTHLNFTDNMQLVIDEYKTNAHFEDKLYNRVFYRVDYHTPDGMESYWIEDKNLEFVIIDGVMPCFKKVEYFMEKDIPLLGRLFLPPQWFRYKPNQVSGCLYLPANPIFLRGELPDNIQLNAFEMIEKADSI